MLRELTPAELHYRLTLKELRCEIEDVLEQESRGEKQPTAADTEEGASMIGWLARRAVTAAGDIAVSRSMDEIGDAQDHADTLRELFEGR